MNPMGFAQFFPGTLPWLSSVASSRAEVQWRVPSPSSVVDFQVSFSRAELRRLAAEQVSWAEFQSYGAGLERKGRIPGLGSRAEFQW